MTLPTSCWTQLPPSFSSRSVMHWDIFSRRSRGLRQPLGSPCVMSSISFLTCLEPVKWDFWLLGCVFIERNIPETQICNQAHSCNSQKLSYNIMGWSAVLLFGLKVTASVICSYTIWSFFLAIFSFKKVKQTYCLFITIVKSDYYQHHNTLVSSLGCVFGPLRFKSC